MSRAGLADPAPFVASDGRVWLAYSAGGGNAIGLVQLVGLEGADGPAIIHPTGHRKDVEDETE